MASENKEKEKEKEEETLLGKLRREFKPRVPKALEQMKQLTFQIGQKTKSVSNQKEINQLFPNTYGQPLLECIVGKEEKSIKHPALKVAVVLSGGQASGGHNVITGLFDAMKILNSESTMIGFLDGPIGVIQNKYIKIDQQVVDEYRNTGGFDMIRSGRDKIETSEQQESALNAVKAHDLDGLVIIGGDDSNTNAAVLAEYFAVQQCKCAVIGVPKTIDGDLQNEYIEMSFGFDTAVKTYSEVISNICRDAKSAAKAWHFIKLMGRDASHVTLDCALQTHVNITLIGEEIEYQGLLLHDIAEHMSDVIAERQANGKDYGVVLIPEGIISFIPSMKALISDLNALLKKGSEHLKALDERPELSDKIAYVREQLKNISLTNLQNFDVLSRDIQAQLLLERDPHGNIQMSQIPIENLFITICEKRLANKKKYKGKLRAQGHFFGYDGRSCYPTNFDAQYCYALGRVAALLVNNRCNGYMTRVYDLEKDVLEWKAGAIPLTMLMNVEIRHGEAKPVIRKCLVDVEQGKKFLYFQEHRSKWEMEDHYRYTGPIQFFGPTELTDSPPFNVLLNKTGDVVWPVHQK